MTAKAAVLEVLGRAMQEIAKIEMAEYPYADANGVKRTKTPEEHGQQDAMLEVIFKLEKISNAYECS